MSQERPAPIGGIILFDSQKKCPPNNKTQNILRDEACSLALLSKKTSSHGLMKIGIKVASTCVAPDTPICGRSRPSSPPKSTSANSQGNMTHVNEDEAIMPLTGMAAIAYVIQLNDPMEEESELIPYMSPPQLH